MSEGGPGKRFPNSRPRGNQRTGEPSARWLAFLAVQSFAQKGLFVSKSLDRLYEEYPTLPRDRQFATELAAETIRRGLTIDTILEQYVTRPRENVEPELWLLLQLGCCQLLFLPQVPPHAAIHETVSLCDRIQKPRAKGFVNGVLRNLDRDASQLGPVMQPGVTPSSVSLDQLESHLLPIYEFRGPMHRWRTISFPKKIFVNPHQHPLEYLAEVCSLPHWLVQRWAAENVDTDQLLNRGLWFTSPGRVSLRVNLNKTTREAVLNVLQESGIEAGLGVLPESIVLAGSLSPRDIPVFHDGWFSVQDESAMHAAVRLDPNPGERILDLCASPGGKTCHLAELLRETGEVVACDLSETRLRPVRENISRLGLENIEVCIVDEDGSNLPEGPFDAALVDAPCSNTGVLGKRAEARWRILPTTFDDLVPLQRRLLTDAISRVKPGGRILYSTCSIDRQENQDVVQSVIASDPRVRLVSEHFHEPGEPADGGYQALLRLQPV